MSASGGGQRAITEVVVLGIRAEGATHVGSLVAIAAADGVTDKLDPARFRRGRREQLSRAEIAKGERTWSASEVADWIAEHHGVRISPGRMRVHLKRANLSYQRTSRSLKHKQKPEEVAKRKDQLEQLEKKGSWG